MNRHESGVLILRQRGQALPLGLALVLLGVLTGFVLYNTGQSAIEKTRLVNAADAAAYSGAQWQARALNFQAYTNRAMVANQVSMAQAVTLRSWTLYGRITGENISRVLSGVPFVNAIAGVVSTVMTTTEKITSPIAKAMLGVIDGVNLGVASSQKAMFASTFVATPQVVDAVITASDPRFTSDSVYGMGGAAANLLAWNGFTDNVTNGRDDYDHMRQRAQLIRESQDDFSRNRDWGFFDDYLYIAPFTKINIVKEGRTELFEREGDNGLEWEWKAKDGQGFHTKIKFWRKKKHIDIPIGWGGAFANNARSDDTIQEGACSGIDVYFGNCARMLGDNKNAERLIDSNTYSLQGTEPLSAMSNYSGLREFRRLSDDTREKAFPTLRLRVEATMPLAGTASTADLATGETFSAPLSSRGDVSSSISIAEAYFKPPDADLWLTNDRLEFANAYSPFWSVRLAPVSAAERLAAFALRSGDDSVPDARGSRVPGADEANASGGSDGGQGGDSLAEGAVSAFASALDIDGGTLSGLTGEYSAQAASDYAGEAVNDFADEYVDGAADEIKAQLQDTLADAAEEILKGIVTDYAGAAGGQLGEYAAGQIDFDVDELKGDVDAAEQVVLDLQDDVERINATIEADFTPVFDAAVDAWKARWGARIRSMWRQKNRAARTFATPRPSSLREPYRSSAKEAARARRQLIDELAVQYVQMTNSVTPDLQIDLGQGNDIIAMFLQAYDASNGAPISLTVLDAANDELVEEAGESDENTTTEESESEV